MIYRIFDLLLSSGIELPELEPVGAGTADLHFSCSDLPPPEVADADWQHHWLDDRGNASASYARVQEGYLVAVPGVADFVFCPRYRSIEGFPHRGADDMASLRHILLDRVIPMCLGHEGAQILHASAVEIEPGQAIALVGDTGTGKSTLAAGFRTAGKPLISDDCLMLVADGRRLRVLPNYPGMRLNDDSAEYLFGRTGPVGSVAGYSTKKRLAIGGGKGLVDAKPELKGIYLLGPGSESIQAEPVSLARDFMPLVKQHFFLDVRNPRQVARQFDNVRRLAAAGVPILQLSYPRNFHRLADVREAVIKSLARYTASPSS